MKEKKDSEAIGKILVDANFISEEQLKTALEQQDKTDKFICSILEELGFATEEKTLVFLSSQLDIPYVKLNDAEISISALMKMPAHFASHYKIMPLDLKDNVLIVAVVDPFDIHAFDVIRSDLGLEVKYVLSTEREIEEAVSRYYGVGTDIIDKIRPEASQEKEKKEVQDVASGDEAASIITFVNQILSEAVKERATDIHLEPYEGRLKARFRVDGILYDINLPEPINYFYSSIVSRIKIMADLNIAERRFPQDGRIKIKVGDRALDLRVSVIPTAFGEAVHIRILSPSFFLVLENLGLLSQDLKLIEEVIKKPHGIILATGPTGSGKSTTLYACLSRINLPGVKIITIEDPVEYQVENITQIQILPKIGLTFAQSLRHILRHDPDVMMVGEIRDSETAEIAIRAALTGHLVFSTLHTNDAAGSVTRLLDMGIESFLLSSSLECLVTQRLVRVICSHCKKKVKFRKEVFDKIKGLKLDPDTEVFEGKGCKECRSTGFKGRTGIYEVLRVTEPIRELIIKRSSTQQIRQKAISEGMRTLRQDGFQKVLGGLTTISEVLNVTQEGEE